MATSGADSGPGLSQPSFLSPSRTLPSTGFFVGSWSFHSKANDFHSIANLAVVQRKPHIGASTWPDSSSTRPLWTSTGQNQPIRVFRSNILPSPLRRQSCNSTCAIRHGMVVFRLQTLQIIYQIGFGDNPLVSCAMVHPTAALRRLAAVTPHELSKAHRKRHGHRFGLGAKRFCRLGMA